MGNHKNRRSQTQKPRNFALAMAMQEKRRSNATEPIPNKKKYSRKDRRDNSYKNGY